MHIHLKCISKHLKCHINSISSSGKRSLQALSKWKETRVGPEVIKNCSYSTQLSTKFMLLINKWKHFKTSRPAFSQQQWQNLKSYRFCSTNEISLKMANEKSQINKIFGHKSVKYFLNYQLKHIISMLKKTRLDGSFENQQHLIWLRNKKLFLNTHFYRKPWNTTAR